MPGGSFDPCREANFFSGIYFSNFEVLRIFSPALRASEVFKDIRELCKFGFGFWFGTTLVMPLFILVTLEPQLERHFLDKFELNLLTHFA